MPRAPFRIAPESGPLSSAGITPHPRYYEPIRHPADPAVPSRGSGCLARGFERGFPSRRARSIEQGFPCCCFLHLPCVLAPIPRRKRAGALVARFPARRRPSPKSGRVGFRIGLFEACLAFTARSGPHVR